MNLMNRFGIVGLLLLLAVPCFSQTKTLPRQETAIAGTRVSMIPPAGFTPSSQFTGYWQESSGSSILVAEFSAPFLTVLSTFASTGELLKKGMTALSEEEITASGQKAVLFHLKQSVKGTEYLKWLLILGNQKESVLITATFPRELESALSEKMRASLLTARWETEKSISPTEGLNFSINEKGELRLATRIVNTLLYTKGGVYPSKDIDDPLFVVGQSLFKVDTGDREQFAKTRLLKTAEVGDIEIEQSSKVIIDKLNGYEILAKAKDKASGQPMVIYQVILFEEQNYFLMLGMVSTKNSQNTLPVYKEMAGTFIRKKT